VKISYGQQIMRLVFRSITLGSLLLLVSTDGWGASTLQKAQILFRQGYYHLSGAYFERLLRSGRDVGSGQELVKIFEVTGKGGLLRAFVRSRSFSKAAIDLKGLAHLQAAKRLFNEGGYQGTVQYLR